MDDILGGARIDYDPEMRRARLSSRQRRVLATIEQATPGGRGWVSGYDVFESLRSSSGVFGANHGRVFNTLRTLSSHDYVRVRLETLPGSTAKRATYRLTDRGADARSAGPR